jgi:4,5-DOPA dioxygenase extradiol
MVVKKSSREQKEMPALFVGHGSPMNALEENPYTISLERLAARIPRPRAILSVSAHWETNGTKVCVHPQPKTIHDFFGFPQELNEFLYPAPGAPEFARQVVKLLSPFKAIETEDWGLDHGTWSVLCHLYPKADVPVFQVSLDRELALNEHFEIGKLLAPIRSEGVMILGSGNIVHNLDLYVQRANAKPYAWAEDFDHKVKELLVARDSLGLIGISRIVPDLVSYAVPTWEHYLPLLYVVGASSDTDTVSFPYEGLQNASISMRTVIYSP